MACKVTTSNGTFLAILLAEETRVFICDSSQDVFVSRHHQWCHDWLQKAPKMCKKHRALQLFGVIFSPCLLSN